MRDQVIGVVVALILGIVGTHFLERNNYKNQASKAYLVENSTEINMGLDFAYAIGLTSGQLDCSHFKDKTNVEYCHQINEVRK